MRELDLDDIVRVKGNFTSPLKVVGINYDRGKPIEIMAKSEAWEYTVRGEYKLFTRIEPKKEKRAGK